MDNSQYIEANGASDEQYSIEPFLGAGDKPIPGICQVQGKVGDYGFSIIPVVDITKTLSNGGAEIAFTDAQGHILHDTVTELPGFEDLIPDRAEEIATSVANMLHAGRSPHQILESFAQVAADEDR